MLISLARLIHSPNNMIRTSHGKKCVCVCVFVFGFALSFTFGCIGLAADRSATIRSGEVMVWCKRSEAVEESTAGKAVFQHQVPQSRAVPMWGGISLDGASPVLFHERKKVTKGEWAGVVRDGSFAAALKAINPSSPCGPWSVLCDNERFLDADVCQAAHKQANI